MRGAYAKEAVSSTQEKPHVQNVGVWAKDAEGGPKPQMFKQDFRRRTEEPTAGRSFSAQPIELVRQQTSTFRLDSPRHSCCQTKGPDVHRAAEVRLVRTCRAFGVIRGDCTMNKTTLLGMFTAAIFATAGVALAQTGQQQKQQPQQGQPQQGQPQQGQQQPQALAQEQIEGRIVAVDKSKGTVSIQTAQHGQLEFKLTQAQVQRLGEGEQVRLQIHIHAMPKQQP
jgi:hypothetical protein